MQVQMKHGLPCLGIGVDDRSKSSVLDPSVFRSPRPNHEQVSQEGFLPE